MSLLQAYMTLEYVAWFSCLFYKFLLLQLCLNECPVLYDIMGPLKICFSVDAVLVATTSPLGFLSDLEQLGGIVL